MADLPLLELIHPLLIGVVTVVIAFLALYKYMKMEKKQSDLIIGIAFLLLTLAMFVVFFNDITNPDFFPDNGLGGLEIWLEFIAFLIFLLAIEPMKVINDLRK